MQDKILTQFVVEKEGVSDAAYEIRELHVKNGDFVTANDLLITYETSKTLIDIDADQDGYFYTSYQEDDTIAVGEVIAYLVREPVDADAFFCCLQPASAKSESNTDLGSPEKTLGSCRLTDSAADLLQKITQIQNTFDTDGYVTRQDLIDKIASTLFYIPSFKGCENRVVFMGAGGMVETAIQAAQLQGQYTIIGILDPHAAIGTEILGIPVIGREEDAPKLLDSGVDKAFISFAAANDRSKRQEAFERFSGYGFEMVNIIHPGAFVDPSASLGKGNLILEGAKVGTQCVVGDNNYINVNSILCHHSIIEGNTHLAPGSIVAGNVTIGKHCLIGMAATMVSGVTIGENCVLNNGVNVAANLEANSIVKNAVRARVS